MIARAAPLVGGVGAAEAMPSEQLLAVLDMRRAETAELVCLIAQAALLSRPEVDPNARREALESWSRLVGEGAWLVETEISKREREDAEQRATWQALKSSAPKQQARLAEAQKKLKGGKRRA